MCSVSVHMQREVMRTCNDFRMHGNPHKPHSSLLSAYAPRARSTRSCVYSTVLKYASMNAEMSQKWSHVKLLPLQASTACQCIPRLALSKCCAAGTCIRRTARATSMRAL